MKNFCFLFSKTYNLDADVRRASLIDITCKHHSLHVPRHIKNRPPEGTISPPSLVSILTEEHKHRNVFRVSVGDLAFNMWCVGSILEPASRSLPHNTRSRRTRHQILPCSPMFVVFRAKYSILALKASMFQSYPSSLKFKGCIYHID